MAGTAAVITEVLLWLLPVPPFCWRVVVMTRFTCDVVDRVVESKETRADEPGRSGFAAPGGRCPM
jgi:hypothetical protein